MQKILKELNMPDSIPRDTILRHTWHANCSGAQRIYGAIANTVSHFVSHWIFIPCESKAEDRIWTVWLHLLFLMLKKFNVKNFKCNFHDWTGTKQQGSSRAFSRGLLLTNNTTASYKRVLFKSVTSQFVDSSVDLVHFDECCSTFCLFYKRIRRWDKITW